MTKLLTKFHKGQKGFTLIELLVVVAILGVIAAVAIPNVIKFIGEGETEAAAAELHNVQVAVSAYSYDNSGAVPTAVAELDPYIIGGSDSLKYAYTFEEDGEAIQGAKLEE